MPDRYQTQARIVWDGDHSCFYDIPLILFSNFHELRAYALEMFHAKTEDYDVKMHYVVERAHAIALPDCVLKLALRPTLPLTHVTIYVAQNTDKPRLAVRPSSRIVTRAPDPDTLGARASELGDAKKEDAEIGVRDGTTHDAPLHPKMDLYDDDDLRVTTADFELPGVKKEDVRVEVHGSTLTVSGDVASGGARSGYAVRERRAGRFSRSLELPRDVKEEELTASLENGVLRVTFPCQGTERPRKRIRVQ